MLLLSCEGVCCLFLLSFSRALHSALPLPRVCVAKSVMPYQCRFYSSQGVRPKVLVRPSPFRRCHIIILPQIVTDFPDLFNLLFRSALLTAASFPHASTKKMQPGSGSAMTACSSFKGYGANECPPDVMTQQGRMSLSFLFFWFWFL